MNVQHSAVGRLVSMVFGVGVFIATLAMPAAASLSSTAVWSAAAQSVWVDRAGSIVTVNGLTVQKRTANGSVVWTANINPSHGFNFSHHLVFDSANNMYLDGYQDDRTLPASVRVVRISAGGTINWSVAYPVGAVNQSEHMAEGPMLIARNGDLYVLGREGQSFWPPYGAKLLRINTSNGSLIGSRTLPPTYDATGAGMSASALASDSNSNIYYGNPDGLFSFSANLATERWAPGAYTNPVRAITLDRWNNLYVTGPMLSNPPYYSMYVGRVNSANGGAVWTNMLSPNATIDVYPRAPFSIQDERSVGGNAIALDSHGYVWAAGRGSLAGSWDGGYVGKFEPAYGQFLWSRLYGENNAGGAVLALAIDDRDNVIVSGMQGAYDPVVPRASLVEVLDAVGNVTVTDGFGPINQYQENGQIAVDKKGNMYWADVTDNGTTLGYNVFSAQLRGRLPTGIATSTGTGKSKVLMGTLDHQNIRLLTMSSSDVLQSGATSWNYGTYGRRDVDLSAGPDGRVRILQQLDFNGTTSAAASVIVRSDTGAVTSSSARNITNLRALKIATGSDNKSYVLLRSTVDGSCQVWRMSSTGAYETSATFTSSTNRAPVAIAVDGTSIVYLIWQGLDGAVYPWRLDTSLTITNQTASYDMESEPPALLVGAGVGADRQLRLFFDLGSHGQYLAALNSSGGFVRLVSQPVTNATGTALSVGADNRSHLLYTEWWYNNWQYAVANSTLTQTSVQFLPIPAN